MTTTITQMRSELTAAGIPIPPPNTKKEEWEKLYQQYIIGPTLPVPPPTVEPVDTPSPHISGYWKSLGFDDLRGIADSQTINRVERMSNEQIYRELVEEFGLNIGPVQGTTREFYQRKLIRLLVGYVAEPSVNGQQSFATEDGSFLGSTESGSGSGNNNANASNGFSGYSSYATEEVSGSSYPGEVEMEMEDQSWCEIQPQPVAASTRISPSRPRAPIPPPKESIDATKQWYDYLAQEEAKKAERRNNMGSAAAFGDIGSRRRHTVGAGLFGASKTTNSYPKASAGAAVKATETPESAGERQQGSGTGFLIIAILLAVVIFMICIYFPSLFVRTSEDPIVDDIDEAIRAARDMKQDAEY